MSGPGIHAGDMRAPNIADELRMVALSRALRHLPPVLMGIPAHRAERYAAAGFTNVTPREDRSAMDRNAAHARAFAGTRIERSAA